MARLDAWVKLAAILHPEGDVHLAFSSTRAATPRVVIEVMMRRARRNEKSLLTEAFLGQKSLSCIRPCTREKQT